MEVSGAQDGGEEEEDADAGIEGGADDAVEKGLADGAGQGEGVADEVELGDLGRPGQEAADVPGDGMEGDVQPAADGIGRGIFPCLEAVAVGQIVGWLIVVEGLVAVLDRGEPGRD